jgi:hypothetical protein
MAKYRKKPIIIDAEIYRPGMEDGFDCGCFEKQEDKPETFERKDKCWDECTMYSIKKWCIYMTPYINTLEGKMYIKMGDYIIKGVKGETYPCKPDIFEMTYEIVKP